MTNLTANSETRLIHAHVTDIVKATRDKDFVFWKAVNEMIDNAIDSKATEIIIDMNGYDLEFIDNGNGFKDKNDIYKALDFGGSQKNGSNIGRYGVGLKDASIKYSTSTLIQTNGLVAIAPWNEIIAGELPPEVVVMNGETRSKGCKIVFANFENKGYFKNEVQSKYYGKLIEQGKIKIIIKGETLEPTPWPKLRYSIQEPFEFEGRFGTITGGVLSYEEQPDKCYTGYNIFYHGRLINTNTSDGRGNVVADSFCFSVDIEDNGDNKWNLGTNKTKLDGDKKLVNYLYETFTKPMLIEEAERQKTEDAKKLAEQIKNIFNGKDLEAEEEHEIDVEANVDHKKPNKGGKKGGIPPKGTGEEHKKTDASSGSPGNRDNGKTVKKQKLKAKKLGDFIHIIWAPIPDNKLFSLDYDIKKSEVMTITFNLKHPEVSKRKEAVDSYFFAHYAQMLYSSQKYIQQNKSDLVFAQEVVGQILDDNKSIIKYKKEDKEPQTT